jgi:hypothetical protein
LVGTTKAYSGLGADIVMESITLIDPGPKGGFECLITTAMRSSGLEQVPLTKGFRGRVAV